MRFLRSSLIKIFNEDDLRIGTWNVEYAYPKRLEAIRQVLANHPADIWILTETHDDLAPPGCPHHAHSLPRPKNWNGIRSGSRWVTIWSKFPILETIVLEGSDEERTVVAKLATGSDRPLLVYGTVLPWKGDRGVSNWDEHHRVIQQQRHEWQAIAAQFPYADLVIAGDYNTDMESGRHYGTKRGIEDLSHALSECKLFCATAPDHLPTDILPYPPIDHISVPSAWRGRTSIASAWPADRKSHSDHSGLVLQIDY